MQRRMQEKVGKEGADLFCGANRTHDAETLLEELVDAGNGEETTGAGD